MIMRLHLDLIDLIRNISSAIDRNESTLGIFLELSKAFDTINHKILSHKLQHYSIRDTALSWIKSYLEDRTQFIQFGWHWSYYRKISCGIPQGSILGPLRNIFSLTQSLLLADETNIFCTHMDTEHLASIASNELAKLLLGLKRKTYLSIWLKRTLWFFIQGKRKLMLMFLLLWKIL